MNLTTLVDEIAAWLQQDLSGTNDVWTESEIQGSVRQAVRDFSTLNLRECFTEKVVYSAKEVSLPKTFIASVRVTKNAETVPLLDVQKLDLSGISSPFTSSGDVQYLMDLHNSSDVRILRVVPQASDITQDVNLWYKSQVIEPSLDDDLIEVNDWLVPWVKFRSLAILFIQDGAGRDADRAEVFGALADALSLALDKIFPTGSAT